MSRYLRDRQAHARAAPSRRGALALGAGLALAGVGFVVLAVIAHHAPYFSWDVGIVRAFQHVKGPWLERPLGIVSAIGFPPLVDVVYGAIGILVFALGLRREAFALGFTAAGSAALNNGVKELVQRPRPPAELVSVAHHINNPTFPAGHVVNATAFFGLLCYLACVRMMPSWRRTSVLALLVAFMVAMGAARIYFGEHWPSDVLGGYLLGLLWLYAGIAFYRRIQPRPRETVTVRGPSAPAGAVARRARAS